MARGTPSFGWAFNPITLPVCRMFWAVLPVAFTAVCGKI